MSPCGFSRALLYGINMFHRSNQTLYCVNLRVTADSNIIFPGALNSVCAEIDVPIAQSVIIGDVPDAYTDVNNEEDMLNLVPSADD